MIARILVFRGGALGDFLLTLPALRLLRTRWPAARIELVGNAVAAGLGVHSGCLDAAYSQHEARWSALFAPAPLPSVLTAWLGGFDLILNYWPDPDRILAGRFPVRSGQIYLAGPAAPASAPAARHFCEPLESLGLATDDFRSRLPCPSIPRGASAADLRGPEYETAGPGTDNPGALSSYPGSQQTPIAIHPGSGSASKNWPANRWRELMSRLDAPILLVLGEAEHERWNSPTLAELAAHCRLGMKIADRLPLPALAAALRRCRLFLGHDSGIGHLAAAVDRPCVLLFGPTDPAMWAPPDPRVRVIRRGATPDCISVEEVLEALGGLRIRS